MSRTVDNRVVEMEFDNKQFESGTKTTLSTLDRLKRALSFDGATKGLDSIKNAGKNIIPADAGRAVDGLSAKFLALTTVGVTALATLTSKAISAASSMAKSFTLDPVMAGFSEYEQKLGSIQTIMSNTARYGTKLGTVNKALNDLNHYADKTIYSFGDMTRNVGLFTNAGLRIGDATKLIKGFSNEAAASGTSAEGAAGAAYQLSQALSAGTIRLMDWRSLQNVGMGNKNMQRGLIEIAQSMGQFNKNTTTATAASKDFNGSLEKKWLSAKVMSKYLKIMATDNEKVNRAQLANIGITGKQADAFIIQQKNAQDAATKVRTFTQLMGTLKEAVGSGWGATFEILFGNFTQATNLFTNVNNVLSGFVNASANARNKVLKDWKKLGGRTELIKAIGNAFTALINVLKPIKDAFREIFPAKTGKDLYNMTVSLEHFTEGLKIGAATSSGLKKTFAGFFAILDIGKQVISGVIGFVARLFGVIGGGTGSIFTFTGSIGDVIVAFDKWLKKTDAIGTFFDKLANISGTVLKPLVSGFKAVMMFVSGIVSGGLDVFMNNLHGMGGKITPILQAISHDLSVVFGIVSDAVGPVLPLLGRLGKALKAAFSFGSGGSGPLQTVSMIKEVHKQLQPVADLGDRIRAAWASVASAFSAVADYLKPVGAAIQGAFQAIKDRLKNFVSNMGMNDALALVNTGFFIAFYQMLKKFTGSLKELVDSASKTFDSIGGVLDQVTKNLKTMQTNVRAEIILRIAGSLALLAAALFVLSKIDPKKLAGALGAVAVMLGEMIGALVALEKVTSVKGAAQMVVISAALAALGLAMIAMAGAVALFGTMDTKTLAKGLGTIAGILVVVVGAAAILDKTGGAAGLLVTAVSLVVLSAALTALSGALLLYAALDTGKMVEGGAKVVASLLAIGIVMRLMPKNMLANAAALFVIANALVVLSGAMKIFGAMSGGEMAKSLIMLGGSLLIISAALAAMEEALPGALALIVAAGALTLLAPAMKALGDLSLKEIGIALIAMAGAFTVLGLAGYLLAPVAPIILLIALGIAALGVAAFAAGAGLLAFATGLGILAASGAAGAAVLVGVIAMIAETFPLIAQQIGLGVIAFAKVISTAGPVLVAAFVTILNSLLDAVIAVLPKLGALIEKLIEVILHILVTSIPRIADAGLKILLGLLGAISKNIGKVADAAGDVIVAFIKAIGRNDLKIIQAGVDTLINFIEGLAKAVRENSTRMGDAGGDLATALIQGMVDGLGAMAGRVVDAAKGVAKKALNGFTGIFHTGSPSRETHKIGGWVSQGLANGIRAHGEGVVQAAKDVSTTALRTLTDVMSRVGDAVVDDIDINPTITPVVDLTEYRKGLSQMDNLNSKAPKVVAAASYNQAATISASETAKQVAAAVAPAEAPVLHFEQNNYSPESLSTAEIYRRTHNQLSQAKSAVGLAS